MLPDLQQEFLSLYPRRDSYICKLAGQDSWRTWTGPLEDHQILGVIADGGRGLLRGCHWGTQTRFAVLDIDAGSLYHNVESLKRISQHLRAAGLKLLPYQSSESGGWHLYLPFDDQEASREVEHTLKRWLKDLGYELKGGQLEVFPSGNALRLPLQPGFAWIDESGNVIRRRDELTIAEALTCFISDLKENAADWQDAKSCIEQQIQDIAATAGRQTQGRADRLEIEGFEHVYAAGGKIQELWEKGRRWWAEGLNRNGERHDAVMAVGHYLWYGDTERYVPALPGGRNCEYRAALIKQWLEQKHNGKCRHINEGNWRIVEEQIRRAVLWRKSEAKERQPYPLTIRLLKRLVAIYKKTGRIWAVEQFERANVNSKLEARERIAEAIRQLIAEGQLITLAEIARRAGAHWRTVKKNVDLLAMVRPLEGKGQKTDTNFDLLARSAVVFNLGGGGVASELPLFSPEEIHSLDAERIEPDSEPEETCHELIETTEAADGIEKQAQPVSLGNVNNLVAMSDYTKGKSLFILPYDAKRRPLFGSEVGNGLVIGTDVRQKEGSASVPLRQPACSEVLAADESRCRHNTRPEQSSAGLPVNHVAGERVSKTAASVYRLVIDAGGKC
jgi:hypothetical protein